MGAVHFAARPRREAGHIAGLDADRPGQFVVGENIHQKTTTTVPPPPLLCSSSHATAPRRSTGHGRSFHGFGVAGRTRHDRLLKKRSGGGSRLQCGLTTVELGSGRVESVGVFDAHDCHKSMLPAATQWYQAPCVQHARMRRRVHLDPALRVQAETLGPRRSLAQIGGSHGPMAGGVRESVSGRIEILVQLATDKPMCAVEA